MQIKKKNDCTETDFSQAGSGGALPRQPGLHRQTHLKKKEKEKKLCSKTTVSLKELSVIRKQYIKKQYQCQKSSRADLN